MHHPATFNLGHETRSVMTPSFDIKENYVLENECVLMRPLQCDDLEHLLDFALKEPEIWKYSLVQAGGEENMRRYINAAVASREKSQHYPYIVFDKVKGAYAGTTRFCDIQLATQSMQMGYTWYGEKFQGSMVNRNCKYLLLEFAFEKMQFERIEFRVDVQNERSLNSLLKLGCVMEGRLRKVGPAIDSERRDCYVLSILKDEWISTVGPQLRLKLAARAVPL